MDQQLLDNLTVTTETKRGVSEETAEFHRKRISHLCDLTGKSIVPMILDVDGTHAVISKQYPNSVTTQRNAVSSISSLFSHSPDFANKHAAVRRRWQDSLSLLGGLQKREKADNRVTPEQQREMASTSEILSAIRKLQKVSRTSMRLNQHYLIFRMHTVLPPKRLDYNALRVVTAKNAPPSYKGNYVLLPPSGKATLVLQKFKTAKAYGALVEQIPSELAAELRQSLRLFPREYVFVGRDGDAMTKSTYGKLIRRVFEEHLGKPCTINSIRHAYISEHATNDRTFGELTNLAKSMGHSTAMQMQYNVPGWKPKTKGKRKVSKRR